MDSSIRIEERAAAWLAQRDSGEWTEAHQRELQSWLEASTAHEVAFVRLEAVWNTADRLHAFGVGVTSEKVPPPNTWHLPPALHAAAPLVKRPKRPLFAIAAGVVLTLAGASAWYLQTTGTTYRTAIGGLSSVPMKDGSRVTLNTDSEIRLAISDKERAVELDRGEAFFEVAPDSNRPFVVKAGRQRITAVGTQFSVKRTGSDAVQVVVTEGKVRVEDASSAQPLLLSAGGIARSDTEGLLVQPQAPLKIEEYVSWRTGFLVFRDVPLADAAAEFNRYNERKLVVRDAAIASIPVSGRFRTTNVDAFVRLVQSGFPIQAHLSSENILLTGRGPQPPTE